MKSKILNLVSLVLSLIMCAMVFASCGKDEDTNGTEDPNSSGKVTTEEGERFDANGYLMDDLPEKADYGGQELTVYMWANQTMWEFTDTDTYPTALVDQALYKREINIEERFNIQIEYVTELGDWSNRESFIQKLANSVSVNDQAYDLVGQYSACVGVAVTQGLYKDLLTVENINTEKPWWPSHAVSSASVNGKVYGLTGDISPTLIRNAQCMYVNLDLFDSYNISQYTGGKSIYQVVKDYEWTLEMLKTIALDKVGTNEGVEDASKMYGISITNNSSADAFLYAGGYKMAEDKNGRIQISEDLGTVAFSDWYDEVQELFNGQHNDIFFNASASGESAFTNGKAIFLVGGLSQSESFAKKGLQFTSLPMPMMDEEQGEYYTCAGMWVSLFSVPVDVKDQSLSGLLMEALASEGYRTITPEIYYNLFQMRYNSGDNQDSAEMFDIVSDSVVFDPSRVFADAFGSFASFRNSVIDPQSNWASTYAGENETWQKKLTSLIAFIG